jgi:hypothetical protein
MRSLAAKLDVMNIAEKMKKIAENLHLSDFNI